MKTYNRQKTETASKIPVLPVTQMIIDKYADHPKSNNEDRLLPILTNQKMNAYLKELGDLCDISKEITFHMARHTFATSVTLTNGVPIETVSKMLGHKNIQTTQHYAKILDIPFAFSSNGDGFLKKNMITGEEKELKKLQNIEIFFTQANETLGRLVSEFEFKKSDVMRQLSDHYVKQEEFKKELSEIYGENISIDINTGEISEGLKEA